MAKNSWIIVLGCLCWQFLYGATIKKNEVAGRIVDESSKQPMEFADVALYRATDSVFITGTVTDKRGCFAFNPVALGTYYIECSFIGYETHRSPVFTISRQTSMDLGILYLRSSTEQLNEVTVKGRRSTYVQRIDKRIFNVGSDLMSTSGSVSDLMRNIPSVQVDVEGNVSLRGNESVTILIDGKPSTLMNARTRADALRQIPATEIERIKVITNPSAQYKPDGVSGIINLVITSAFAHRPCRSRLENHPPRPLTGERQLQPPSFHPYRKYLCCRPECQSGDHLPKRTLPLRQRKRKRLGGWKRLHAYLRQGARTGGRLQLFVIGGAGRQPICHLLYR